MALDTRRIRGGGSVGLVSVGALQRQDPIPVGVYYISAVGQPAITHFDQWVRAQAGKVHVKAATQEEPRSTTVEAALALAPFAGLFDVGRWIVETFGTTQAWILFEVREPVPRWIPGTHGLDAFPSIAPQGLATQISDVDPLEGQREPDALEKIAEVTDLPTWVWLAIAGGAVSTIVGLLIRRR